MGVKKPTLYPNLMAELARAGISLTRLAARMGMTRNNLYNKVNGLTNFTLKDITLIQEILRDNENGGDFSLDYLFAKGDGE